VIEKRPYFRGYLFAETDQIMFVEQMRGVVCVVGNGLGEPLTVPASDMELLLDVADETGMISEIDATRLSYRFRGRPGDLFEFIGCGLDGGVGKIVSLDRLDSHGEITAIVQVFGAEREISVPYRSVGVLRVG
jgi:transcription antitermination factor NusG